MNRPKAHEERYAQLWEQIELPKLLDTEQSEKI